MSGIFDILPQEFRRRGLGMAATLLARSALNLAGLAALLPVLALVLDPAGFEGGGTLARVYTASGIASPRTFALAVCGAVVVFIGLKCGVNFLLARTERRYIYDLYRTLSRRLYVTYHDRGLAFVTGTNSSTLARNVNVVCLAFAAGVLRPAAAIFAESALLAMLLVALFFYAPLAALLATAVFLPAAWLYYALVRKRIDRCGERENRAQREKARLVAETFRGYADIELSNAFPGMLLAFDRTTDEVVRTRSRETDIGQLPAIFTEVGLATGMALLAAFSIGEGEARMLFGVFAVAALRLMPSVRNVLASWTTIRNNRYTIRILYDAALAGADAEAPRAPETETDATRARSRQERAAGAEHPKTGDDETLPFDREIAVRSLSFRFPGSGRDVLHDVSFTIRKGERIGIRGASGAGKSTLCNLLLGLYRPTSGEIAIDGVPLTAANRRAWQNRIGYVSQHLFLSDGSVAANVAPGIAPEEIDRRRVAQALEAARLGDFVATLPQGIDTPVGECGYRLSGGQRQRIGIARALYRRADVLFFDEATSSLDSRTEEEVNRAVAAIAARNPGMTLLVIAHRETSLGHCDRILTLKETWNT